MLLSIKQVTIVTTKKDDPNKLAAYEGRFITLLLTHYSIKSR